ncbi:hypothetical protein KAR91_72820 [Candidatus Pacearchaeota archaeon]|nr:hypothetical protein [Candidatus Pacearchaeota archaeon]
MKARILAAILSLAVSLPVFMYLFHSILVKIDATELEFFLFWIYLPCTALSAVIFRVTEGE